MSAPPFVTVYRGPFVGGYVMQFLETIEGKSGEELTSVVLKFLLVNSSTMRELFITKLRHNLPASKVPTFRDGIICHTEVATKEGDDCGRIDLLIREEYGMVFGLENKFWADFTPNQPKKYLPYLEGLTNEASIRLIVLIPKARSAEIHKHLVDQSIASRCIVIFWEDLRKDLEHVARNERTEVAAAALYLDEYVHRRVLETSIEIAPHQVVGPSVYRTFRTCASEFPRIFAGRQSGYRP